MTHYILYIYHKVKWQRLQTGKTYTVNVKVCWEGRKNKDEYLIIFKQLFL